MMTLKFPALYCDADSAAVRAQSEFLLLVGTEYALLITAAIMAMEGFGEAPPIITAIVFLAALAAMLVRTLRKADQDWYKCRALAESIKTLTWRYAMRAKPFDDPRAQTDREDFGKYLEATFKANQHIGHRVAGLSPHGEQITVAMDETRAKSLAERKEFYLKNRIRDQRRWYAGKAKTNKKILRRWIIACAAVYVAAISLVLANLDNPEWPVAVEPLIVVAAAIIGWIQIKRYSELASAYALTAHEIGIIEERARGVSSNEAFSQFVNDAEHAFSREHTQWVARQQQI
jgi:hypothetical protein